MDESFPSEGADAPWQEAYVALGSNQGDRLALLTEALRRMHTHPDMSVLRVSGIYETDPVGYADQPAFLNMAAALRSRLQPLELLRALLHIERELGRVRTIRNGPRTIDLDLLYMQNIIMTSEELTLPHPRMMERAFVLVPLRDVLHDTSPLKETVEDAVRGALRQGKEGIALWNTINWPSASALFES
ncbi:2-amino-4-hydroxy-6-hydroxymethyldihydropteridine pyrophosphokinase [Paenibacillus darwinianus]|uniref:2-amino-4-hydroxy-6-hydroxymethyldihydropteridine diphosphokinase n=1 Tax=Paenibacillus darwinianus TaxID=1380763 RepID=A0A9W5S009_9BACL|nr:2-amino-4-hydroxy-6-hydroxymethyldihydropteridine diphosphokinase [Paenibacillus darwinianus]EXX86747.1 2-amino-4-hydroxy-6-hydroxymethyldihydropteridine pyrophosphokinase [Paenibacillus darwinianus]EXX87615.1 2-amino-4-hydroxy-6-hydroxymethyldihydropteridine pyrophosphokinase [Paenibacillus darwinianus]EXX87649.1 2-amino-4-hydroxy-6-hydroxymethyldihydropteridine pyrophosphokinase [Paenibacillus darwinianus]